MGREEKRSENHQKRSKNHQKRSKNHQKRSKNHQKRSENYQKRSENYQKRSDEIIINVISTWISSNDILIFRHYHKSIYSKRYKIVGLHNKQICISVYYILCELKCPKYFYFYLIIIQNDPIIILSIFLINLSNVYDNHLTHTAVNISHPYCVI